MIYRSTSSYLDVSFGSQSVRSAPGDISSDKRFRCLLKDLPGLPVDFGINVVPGPSFEIPKSGSTLNLVAVKHLGKMILLVFGCFGPVFSQSWPQDSFKRVRLDKMMQNAPKN